RSQQKAFGRGSLKMLAPSNRRILAYLREYAEGERQDSILCVANLSRAAQAVELDLASHAGKVPVEMIGGMSFPPIGELTYLLTLPPYGFYWFYLADATQMPSWHVAADERLPELPTLVVKQRLGELLQGASRNILEGETLPAYLPKRRWFAGEKGLPRLCYIVPLDEAEPRCALCEVEIDGLRYQLPLGFLDADQRGDSLPQLLALARLRRGRKVGLLTDAASLPLFARKVLAQLRAEAVIAHGDGEIQFIPAAGLAEMDDIADEDVLPFSVEQSNSSIRFGERMVLKVLRKILPGLHPEIEVGGYLTRHGYPGIAPLLGEVRRVGADGEPHTLMILQGYLNNQGDAWNWTLDNLERAVRDEIFAASEALEGQYDSLAELRGFAANLGARLGEMHSVLAGESDDPAFGSRESDEASVQAWALRIAEQLREAGKRLSEPPRPLQGEAAEQARRLLERLPALLERLPLLARQAAGGLLIRVHGDLHLGQVLMVQGDARFIDFEGEPARSLEERRQRHSPMKDVGGMLRSFDYAAAMVLRNAQSTDSSEQADSARRKVAMRYRSEARDAFLAGYRAAAAGLMHAWHGREGEGAALALACLEKAAYELLYEADYRPDWLEVPLAGLAELTEHLLKGKNR
ncbi:putative maltokinase, partial [Pseudomonas aeruginosa]|uniref:putative maltokinase n=1 Tax=Pseudomonas aeruginosa TaxID=287 RepID=UPI003967EBD2